MRTTAHKGWLESLDRSPFDETFHNLEDVSEHIEDKKVLADSGKLPIFWAA